MNLSFFHNSEFDKKKITIWAFRWPDPIHRWFADLLILRDIKVKLCLVSNAMIISEIILTSALTSHSLIFARRISYLKNIIHIFAHTPLIHIKQVQTWHMTYIIQHPSYYYFIAMLCYPTIYTHTHTLQSFNTIFHLHFTSFLIIHGRTRKEHSRPYIHNCRVESFVVHKFEKRQKHVY